MTLHSEKWAKGLLALLLVTFGLLTTVAFAQTTVLLPLAPAPYFDPTTGLPMAGGTLSFYASGSFTPQAIFTDSGGQTQLSNPVTLNAAGFPQNASGSITAIWLTPGIAYRVVGKNSQGVQRFLEDGVAGLASSSAFLSSVVPFATTMTFNACASNQLFFVTLTGNVNSSSFNECPGVQLPAIVTFEFIQDQTGGHSFQFPPNASGGNSVNQTATAVTVQPFLWDGTSLQALAPANSGGKLFSLDLTSPLTSNRVTLLNSQGPSAPLVGNGIDKTVYSYLIPANVVAAGKGIRVTVVWAHSTGVGSVAYKLYFGGNPIDTPTAVPDAHTGGAHARAYYDIFNQPTVTNSQNWIGDRYWGTTTGTGVSAGTASVDMTNQVQVMFTFNASSSEQVTPTMFVVELIQ